MLTSPAGYWQVDSETHRRRAQSAQPSTGAGDGCLLVCSLGGVFAVLVLPSLPVVAGVGGEAAVLARREERVVTEEALQPAVVAPVGGFAEGAAVGSVECVLVAEGGGRVADAEEPAFFGAGTCAARATAESQLAVGWETPCVGLPSPDDFMLPCHYQEWSDGSLVRVGSEVG
jgi:hypothetical protein